MITLNELCKETAIFKIRQSIGEKIETLSLKNADNDFEYLSDEQVREILKPQFNKLEESFAEEYGRYPHNDCELLNHAISEFFEENVLNSFDGGITEETIDTIKQSLGM